MILRQGEINVWHFAHEKDNACDLTTENKMTAWHYYHQAAFDEDCREVVLEHNGIKHIADIKWRNLIIEYQHSPISNKVFEERNDFYRQFGMLFWVFDMREACKSERIYRSGKAYKWEHANRTLAKYDFQTLSRNNMRVFFELLHGTLVEVTWNKQGLKYFSGQAFDPYRFRKYAEWYADNETAFSYLPHNGNEYFYDHRKQLQDAVYERQREMHEAFYKEVWG